MRQFLLLLRVQVLALVNSIAPARMGAKGSRTSMRLVGALVAVVLLVCVAVAYMVGLGAGLAAAGLVDAIPVLAVLLGSVAGVAFTFMKANGTLFGMADYDLLMSLPVARRTVVASRMVALFGTATMLGAVLIVPLYAVYFSAAPVTVVGLLAAVTSVLLAPAIPTSLAIFVSFALTAVAARFRHANLVYIAFVLVTLMALVVGSYGLSFSVRAGGGGAARLLADMSVVAGMLQGGIAHLYPPAGFVAHAVTTGSLPALGVFAACSLVVPAVCLEIMQRYYLAINGLLGSQGRRGGRGAAATLAAAERASSPFKALVVKEFRTQIGIPTYAINCLLGYLLMLAFSIALVAVGARGLLESGMLGSAAADVDPLALRTAIDQIFLLVPWCVAFCAVVSPSAAVSVSLEGRGAWLMATAPVSACTILGAKLASNAIPMAVMITVGSLVMLVGEQIDALGALETLVVGFGMFYLVANVGMLLDARRPNFAWSSAQEVVKRGLPIMACVLGGMVLVFGLGAGTLAIALAIGAAAAHAFALSVGAIGMLAGHVLFRRTCRLNPFCRH